MTRAKPISAAKLTLSPGPVKARLPEDAVTGWAAFLGVPEPPEVLVAPSEPGFVVVLPGSDVVEVVGDVVVVADVVVVGEVVVVVVVGTAVVVVDVDVDVVDVDVEVVVVVTGLMADPIVCSKA
jgi:hypothetical protein